MVATGTTAFRVFSGPGCWIERFGRSALISVRSESEMPNLVSALEQWGARARWLPERTYKRLLVCGPGESDVPVLVGGEAGESPREIVTESGLCFEVDFSAGYSPGLFCDQRGNRDFLRKLSPRRTLNTFAYTCAFSVAAAAVGSATLSVDISKSSLQRGRRNFELNGIDLFSPREENQAAVVGPTSLRQKEAVPQHRFVAEDVPTYLARLARRGEKFDAIILDPPTFGRGGAHRTFRVERDFESLLLAAVEIAAPGASILLSTNYAAWNEEDLRQIARRVSPGNLRFEKPVTHPLRPRISPETNIWMVL